MSLPAVRVAALVLAFATAMPLSAQTAHWPPPPLPGPPYPYPPNYPYPYAPPYYGCPGGYLTIRGDTCEPYFPLTGGAPRKPDGCPPHYNRYGAICKPTR
jgi:hypothetical protein